MKEPRAELVRIDPSGTAHPIGGVASQRMRSRLGAYRILPAPNHVVFMRFTGEDGRRDDEDGAVVRIAGEITTAGALCDIFAMVGQTGWRGELAVLDGENSRSLFFEHGNVVGVQTNADGERIGNILYKFGVLTEDQHQRVLARVRMGKRFGAAAVELGVLTQEQVYSSLARQIEEVVYATLTIGDGTFFFLDGFDDGRLVTRHAVSVNALLMDAVTRMDEMRYFRERIPSGNHIPHRQPTASQPADEYRSTLDAIDGLRSVEEIGRVTGRGEFATTKDLYALVQSKQVTIQAPRVSGGLASLVVSANEALKLIHVEADWESYGPDLRQSLSHFAVGAGVYEILFRGAGPDQTGALDPERVAENASLVAHGEDPERIVRQMLSDYVGFAVFSVGGMLGEEKENQISRQVGPLVSRFQPKG